MDCLSGHATLKTPLARPAALWWSGVSPMSAPKDTLRRYSSIVVDGPDRSPNRSMLRAVGFSDEDFGKPIVGVASTWSMVTPCNMHIDQLAREAAAGADGAGGKAVIFGTITVSDGISMGTPGMRYSMVSREVIADSIETVSGAEGFDAVVAIGGCDKNMPGCLMALARLNRPSVFVYGGTILPGILPGSKKECDIVSVFEAVGRHSAGKLDDAGLHAVEVCSIPGPGSCGGMYTANTMASAIEALGMSLPDSSSQLAVGPEKRGDCRRAGEAAVALLKAGVRPRDILTRKAFENAINQTEVSVVKPGLQTADRVGADYASGLANLHPRQARGALKKRISRDADAGANHSAHVFALQGNAVEGGGRAEIDDHTGAAVLFECRYGVHDAVCAHFRGIVVMHRHAGFHPRLDQQRLGIKVPLTDLTKNRIKWRHHG